MKGDCLMPKIPLTPKQLKLLKFLKSFYDEHEYMPSYKEICEVIGVKSTNTVHDALVRLDRKGHIKRFKEGKYGGNRAIELI